MATRMKERPNAFVPLNCQENLLVKNGLNCAQQLNLSTVEDDTLAAKEL